MWKRSTWNVFAILALVSSLRASPLKPHAVYDFSKGLDSYHSSLSLPEGFVHSSDNVLFDSQAPISKRQGYTIAFSSTASAGQTAWTYTDSTNTSWIIERTSAAIIANSLSGGSSVLIATVSANNLVGEVNAFGNAYFTDQTQGVYYWNGTSTVFVSGSPKGSLIAQWHGRVWVSGLAVPNGNLLYGSKQYDGTVWATGLNPNDPVILTVGLQDNLDSVSALYPYLDTLYVFKHFLTYAIYGFDQTSFQISFITSECGCIDQQSIQTFASTLKFVSERGVESFDGYACTRISDPIKNLVDPAIQSQGGSGTQSWVQSGLSDWAAGTFSANNNISTMTVAPAMQWKGAGKDFSASDFNAGTLTGLSMNAAGLQITTNTANVRNNSFESGNNNWIFGFNTSVVTSNFQSLHCFGAHSSPKDGSHFVEYADGSADPSTIQVALKDCTSPLPILSSATFSTAYLGNCAWNQLILPGVTPRKCVFVQVNNVTSPRIIATSDEFFTNGNTMSLWYIPDSAGLGGIDVNLDFFQDGRTDNEANSQISRTFDTGKTSSTVVPKITATVVGSTPTFVLQTSTDSAIWSDVTHSTGSAASVNRYVRYVSTWNFSNVDFQTAYQAVDLQPFIFVSTWTSGCHSIGGATSFGNLAVTEDLTGGATLGFSVCSSPNSNCSSSVCSSVLPNSQITVATNTFIDVIATFTATATTNTVTLNSITAQWFTGNRSSPMSSTIWDNRYWLSLTTTTADSANDAILVLSSKGAWGLYDIHAGGLVQYKNNLYHTDSLPSGNVYLDNQGYNDNGVAINAFIQTKDYCQQGPTQEDYYESLYPSMDNLGNYNMSISYEMDRDPTNVYSLSPINQTEFSNNTSIKIPFVLNAADQNFGKCISFTFTESDLNSPWNFYGWTDYSHERSVQ